MPYPNQPETPRRVTRTVTPLGPGGQPAPKRQDRPDPYYVPPARQQQARPQMSQAPASRTQSQRGNDRKARKRFPIWTVPVVFACFAALLVLAWYVQGEYTAYQNFQQVVAVVNQPGFYPGITVDGTSVAGRSLEETQSAFALMSNENAAAFGITVTDGQRNWRITAQEMPLTFNIGALLEQAYALGRSGNLQTRYATIRALEQHGWNVQSEMVFDSSRVGELVSVIGDRLDTAVVEGSVTAFDMETKTFVFGNSQPGYAVDRARLEQDILAALDRKDFDTPIYVTGSVVSPTYDGGALAASYGKIASFTTETTNDSNRNTNISLSCQAINGSRVMPGETFSFNGTTGERASSKGYKEAGAISGGQLVDAFGGGVCQTSSTLFNAVVRANLEIVERNKHSWPSSYVEKGEDAAVDYPRLDFKFKNTQDTPVFIIAWYENRTVTVEIYGQLLPNGVHIDLYSEVMKIMEPSNDVIYTQNSGLAAGTQKEVKKKRTGYEVDTYKIYYQNGEAVAKEKLWTTTYNPVQKEVYYN